MRNRLQACLNYRNARIVERCIHLNKLLIEKAFTHTYIHTRSHTCLQLNDGETCRVVIGCQRVGQMVLLPENQDALCVHAMHNPTISLKTRFNPLYQYCANSACLLWKTKQLILSRICCYGVVMALCFCKKQSVFFPRYKPQYTLDIIIKL